MSRIEIVNPHAMKTQNHSTSAETLEYAVAIEGNKEIFGSGALTEVGAHAHHLGMRHVALFVRDLQSCLKQVLKLHLDLVYIFPLIHSN